MSNIVVDLTPLLPGGENGGAKPMVLGLMRALPEILPQQRFILLTSRANHTELAFLERPNVTRYLTNVRPPRPPLLPWLRYRLKLIQLALVWGTFEIIARLIPRPVKKKLRGVYYRLRGLTPPPETSAAASAPVLPSENPRSPFPGLLKTLQADLLFCPFTAPVYAEEGVPTLAVIYDLQFLDLPQFFGLDDLLTRQKNLRLTLQRATRLACISHFARQSVLKNSDFPPERVTTVQIGMVYEPQSAPPESALLKRFGLKTGEFFFYPANFWPHKNHATLLLAFSFYRRAHPQSPLNLVCTGALEKGRQEIALLAHTLGLEEHLCLPGYVSAEDLTLLYQSACALVFPSLYEGFGMPVVEAMANRLPVLCSNQASLPEVAGDAALFFDPRSPKEIAATLEKFTALSLAQKETLVEKGLERAQLFGDSSRMAREYADLILSMLPKHEN